MKKLPKAFAYSSPQGVVVPVLKTDKLAFERSGQVLTTWGRRERRIVANLIAHLNSRGFIITAVNDGGDDEEAITDNNMKEAMEAAFAVDEATLIFAPVAYPDGPGFERVYLVFNNGNDGLDVISEHGTDGLFGDAMDAFDAKVFA